MALGAPIQALRWFLSGTEQSGEASRFHLLSRRGRRAVVVQLASGRLRDVLIRHTANDEALLAAAGPGNNQLVADPDIAMGLGDHAVDHDPADLAFPLRLGSRSEQAGNIEPDIESNGVTHDQVGGRSYGGRPHGGRSRGRPLQGYSCMA